MRAGALLKPVDPDMNTVLNTEDLYSRATF